MRAISGRSLSLSMRLYRSLLRAYPAAFLAEFEDLLCQAFGDLSNRAVRTNGIRGLFALWIRSIPDIANSALRERFRSASDWSFRLRWILACSIAIPTPFMLVFLAMFISRRMGLLFESPSNFVTFTFLLSTSLHGLTSGYLQSLAFGWKRPRRFLWVLATVAGMTICLEPNECVFCLANIDGPGWNSDIVSFSVGNHSVSGSGEKKCPCSCVDSRHSDGFGRSVAYPTGDALCAFTH